MAAWKMSGCGLLFSASSEDVSVWIRSSICASCLYFASSPFLAEEARAICLPSDWSRLNSARTSGKAVTWYRYRVRRISPRCFFERLSPRFQLARIQKHGHQLIAAFTDLAANIFELEVVP